MEKYVLKLSTDNQLLVYERIVEPIWTYGIESWGALAKSHVAELAVLHRKRTVLPTP